MIISNAQYIQNEHNEAKTIIATIDGQKLYVPLDPANRHYAALLEWVDEGNTIQDAD